ncbi:hypothetical protein [Longimicrobium sp.]|uniref:hypothetical protein n=1 Tax=Longimicrobium sp. TaxID=2029185 RepID=UPI002BED12C5|nr:hypothetical protein [Longimicrobium sp.]HSU15391.1 hypothetical protein [Longimicrobium sp.]
MAIIVSTGNPGDLLKSIYKGIDDGDIETWSYDSDGDFTHTPDQWRNKAWLVPKVGVGELRFGILKQKDVNLSKLIYGVYHGRFIEMLLNHFDNAFSGALATAHKTTPDIF